MHIINPKMLETGLGPIVLGLPYTFLLRIEAFGIPTFCYNARQVYGSLG